MIIISYNDQQLCVYTYHCLIRSIQNDKFCHGKSEQIFSYLHYCPFVARLVEVLAPSYWIETMSNEKIIKYVPYESNDRKKILVSK